VLLVATELPISIPITVEPHPAAMLKPGGVLYLNDLVYSFEPGDAGRAIEVWLDEVAVEQGDGFPRGFFEAHVREEYSTYTWLLEAMLDKVGFRIEDAWYDLKAYAAYICVKW
jgi:hypothetical protein